MGKMRKDILMGGAFIVICLAFAVWVALSYGSEKIIPEIDPVLRIVSKTEYVPGDDGQVIAELRDKSFNPINASCNAIILYPNKTIFLDGAMLSGPIGNYYINFTAPKIYGVFEYQVNCSFIGRNAIDSSSFHITEGRMRAWIEK